MKRKLKTLIAEGKTKQAIGELLAIAENLGDGDLRQEIILQSARFEKISQGQRMGTTSFQEEGISIAKINKALLEIIERLPDRNLSNNSTSETNAESIPSGNKKGWWKYIAAAAVIIGIFGSLAEVLNFINIIPSNSGETAQLTVYVHGPGGLQDYVLENKGELLVDLDGDRRFAKIGEKGRTVFNEIPSKFKGSHLPIAVKAEGFEAVESNKKYEWKDKAIYFPIQVDQQLLQIKGIVKNIDGSSYLAKVSIMIENEFITTTDSLGRFSYEMKADQAKEKYALSFNKEGYLPLSEFYYPKSSKEFRLTEK